MMVTGRHLEAHPYDHASDYERCQRIDSMETHECATGPDGRWRCHRAHRIRTVVERVGYEGGRTAAHAHAVRHVEEHLLGRDRDERDAKAGGIEHGTAGRAACTRERGAKARGTRHHQEEGERVVHHGKASASQHERDATGADALDARPARGEERKSVRDQIAQRVPSVRDERRRVGHNADARLSSDSKQRSSAGMLGAAVRIAVFLFAGLHLHAAEEDVGGDASEGDISRRC